MPNEIIGPPILRLLGGVVIHAFVGQGGNGKPNRGKGPAAILDGTEKHRASYAASCFVAKSEEDVYKLTKMAREQDELSIRQIDPAYSH